MPKRVVVPADSFFCYTNLTVLNPNHILDRYETCRVLGVSRQTLISWIRKGKLKVWKRVGQGSNAALLFERDRVEALVRPVTDPDPSAASISHR